jgi:hypothetical protein
MIIARGLLVSIALCASSATAFELPKLPEIALPEISFPTLPDLPEFPPIDFPDLPFPKLEEVVSIEKLSSMVDDFARTHLGERDYLAIHGIVLDVQERPLWWWDVALGAAFIGGGSAAAGGICAQFLPISESKAKTICGRAAGMAARVVLSKVAELFDAEMSQEAVEFGASIGSGWGHSVAMGAFRAVDEALADEWYYPATKELIVWSVGQLVN